MSGRERTSTLKERMAYETARIMVEQHLPDFDRARRKAAERTGIFDRRNWPSNELVQEAVLTQRRLFNSDGLVRDRRFLYARAADAMRYLQAFSPRLVGATLHGISDPSSGIELLLFADHPEEVLFALMDRQIPWQTSERSFRYPGEYRHSHPVYRLVIGDIPFQLIVLPKRARHHPPLDPISDRPQRGADLAAVEAMLAAEPLGELPDSRPSGH